MHFPTQILGQSLEGSILLGLLNFLIGWSIAHHRMLPIVYVVISSNLILEINLVGILLLESDSRIGSARRLQRMRESGWESLFDEVSSFCDKNCIKIPSMDDIFTSGERPNRKAHPITNVHHYRVDLFTDVIDKQLIELNDRFTEKNTELLLCVACLSPSNSFSAFDKEKLMRLAQFYPSDFSEHDLELLKEQLENYIWDMTSNSEFADLKGISDLAQKMVGTKKDHTYPLVYLLLTLALILPVATASVERVFSAMNIVKNTLRNRMGDLWMNDCLVAYIEKDIFNSIEDEAIMQQFQNMKTRRGQLF
ncbi:hypothetical protein ACFX1Q_021131 [Malus domestica]